MTSSCRRRVFTDAQQDAILDHYPGAGQRTAGGILHAFTSAAQLQDGAALRAMSLAITHQR